MESYQVELWRAEAVKNWAQALANLSKVEPASEACRVALIRQRGTIIAKVNELLDITDG